MNVRHPMGGLNAYLKTRLKQATKLTFNLIFVSPKA